MREQEKKRQRFHHLLKDETMPKLFFFFLSTVYKAKKKYFTEKEPFKGKGEWRIKQKTKRPFNCTRYAIKKKRTPYHQ